jgi:hypothetical protein
VNAAIPTIVFEAKDAGGDDLVAVKVTMDGQPIADRLEGTALSIDPGAHTFTFESAGKTTVQKQFVIREGEKDRRERIAFGGPSVATVPEPTPGAASILASSPAAPAPSDGASGRLGARRILALVAAGVGVVGLGVGVGFGIDSKLKHDDAHNACPEPTCADRTGVDLWNQAVSAGNVSTVAFIVGAAGLAGGAALWFTAPHRSGESAETAGTQVGLGPGMLQLKGVW